MSRLNGASAAGTPCSRHRVGIEVGGSAELRMPETSISNELVSVLVASRLVAAAI